MALRFVDGFDHYATAQILQKWSSNATGVISAGNGRNSTQSYRHSTSNDFATKSLTTSGDTAIIGFAWKTSDITDANSANAILKISASGTDHVSITVNASGQILAKRGDGGGTTLGTSSVALSSGSFAYIEVKAVIDNAAGAVTIRVNGSEVLAVSGVDTNAGGGSDVWDTIMIGDEGAGTSSATRDFDDLYACDGSGSVNNDFLGPVRVKTIYPDGAGNSTDFTPSAGSNFENVDEALTDSDTTYNSESSAGDHDTYTYGSVGLSGTVKGVQVNMLVRSDGAGSETVAPMVRLSATDYQGTTQGLTTSYTDVFQVYETSPDTSTAWTVAEIDGAEFGIKLVS
jgi:hypothetical protein